MRSVVWCIATLCVCNFGAAATPAARTQVRLLLSHEAARPGETVTAGVEFQMPARAHIYWRNPGDAGLPTEISWTLPRGITAGRTRWPVPEKFDEAGVTTYGYSGSAMLIVPLHIDRELAPGPAELQATVTWLECDQSCVPGKTNLKAALRLGPESRLSAEAELIGAQQMQLPVVDPEFKPAAKWEAGSGNTRSLIIRWRSEIAPVWADFFPDTLTNCVVASAAPVQPGRAGYAQLKLSVTRLTGSWPKRISGVLVQKFPTAQTTQAWEVALEPAGPGPPQPGQLLRMLVLGFLGGLILNVMPCVFPVIALKILGFVRQSTESPGRVLRLGLIAGCGVLVSFLALAIAVILVQRAGKAASWGMHMQNPQFTLVLTVVVTLVALNLFGVFEVTLGSRTIDAAGRLGSRPGAWGAFMNGALATVLATPCTAPLLAPALGFAFTQPPAGIVIMFLAVGSGLAMPYVLLSWRPHWLKFLPKPGPWLERFKVLMGFPMLATAVWLFSFTSRRFGPNGPLWLGLFLVALALAGWIWGEFVQRGTKRRALAMAISLLVLLSSYLYALEKQLHWRATQRHSPATAGTGSTEAVWQKWSPEAVAKARAEGRPVLVDFTADWCVTCKYNKLVALDTAEVRNMLQQINAVAFVADNTDEDPVIIAELHKFGRAGVPLVLVYPRDTNAPPIVLPTLLTKSIVLDALAKAAR